MALPVMARNPPHFETLVIRIGNHEALHAAFGEAYSRSLDNAVRARLADAGVEMRKVSMRRGRLLVPLPGLAQGNLPESAAAWAQRLAAVLAREPVTIGADRAYLHLSTQILPAAGAQADLGLEPPPWSDASRRAGCRGESSAGTTREADTRIATALLDALRAGQLVLAFQPVVAFERTGADACLYSEALLRRMGQSHYAMGECASAIEALERLGWISRLDASVAWTVVALLERYEHQRLGCNISAASLHHDAWWVCLLDHLRHHPSLARRLTLEITETSAIADSAEARTLLDAVRSTGARIAIDDVGSDQRSLSFLAEFQADVIKIDRSVTLRGRDETQSPALLKDLVAECARYCSCVIVEGIERPGDLALARHSRAQGGQGFLIGMPVLQPEWLLDRRAMVVDLYAEP